jgi:hypothetical protein
LRLRNSMRYRQISKMDEVATMMNRPAAVSMLYGYFMA